jgi:hypothetical protein
MTRWVWLGALLLSASCGGSSSSEGTTGDQDTGTSSTDDTDTPGDDSGGSTDDSSTSGDSTSSSETGGDTGGTTGDSASDAPTTGNKIKYVWIIVEENHNWSSIKGKSEAPYINSLLTEGAHAEKYYNPKSLHPSEPNYIWMEAGDNLGVTDDSDPKSNHQSTKDHLVTKLEAASVTWKSWQEDMPDPTKCPLTSKGNYAAKHNPMVFFDDVTDNLDSASKHCIDHMAPTTQLITDLAADKVPQYNFITPNLCNDMHGATTCFLNLIKKGDDWLKNLVPKIQATKEYKEAGAIFITWDEGEGSDGPIGMIVLSPFAKKGFTDDTNTYTHSSLLRTVQTIFGVTPYLRDADKAKDLSNLFTAFP